MACGEQATHTQTLPNEFSFATNQRIEHGGRSNTAVPPCLQELHNIQGTVRIHSLFGENLSVPEAMINDKLADSVLALHTDRYHDSNQRKRFNAGGLDPWITPVDYRVINTEIITKNMDNPSTPDHFPQTSYRHTCSPVATRLIGGRGEYMSKANMADSEGPLPRFIQQTDGGYHPMDMGRGTWPQAKSSRSKSSRNNPYSSVKSVDEQILRATLYQAHCIL